MKNSKIRTQRGFTLIELMIGLALGLIASLAIFSTISSFESQRRTTGSGVDMQQNGLMALYAIEQDIRMAGFGLIDASTKPGSLPCATINDYKTSQVFTSAPVLISNGSTGTDIITINRLNSDSGGIVTGGNTATLTAPFSAAGAMSLDTNAALNVNDFILVSQATLACTLLKVTAKVAGGITTATAGNAISNTPGSPAAFPNYAASAVVIDLGPASTSSATTFGSTSPTATPTFATTKYQINGSLELIRSEDAGTNWSTVASNIVTVAAQYGVSDVPTAAIPTPQPVTCWTDATGSACSGTNWATPSVADIKRIKAIRVGILARSAQKTSCNNSTPAWYGGAIDVSGIVGADWACYRYKIYQTIIPIRNVIWGNL
jgi:type IV pilus assembly protein PilW